MSLQYLIKRVAENDDRLRMVIENDNSLDEIRKYDRTLLELFTQILHYEARTSKEVGDKLKFFLNRIQQSENADGFQYALNAIEQIIDCDLNKGHSKIKPDNLLPDALVVRQIQDGKTVDRMGNTYDLVSDTHDRLSIIDTDFRYVNTSSGNSIFYEKCAHEVVGRHVGDLIGSQRFENRAKRFLERCFSGIRQEYFHSLEINNESRVLNCQMMPLYGTEGQPFGALVAMNDVTDVISGTDHVFLEPLGT